MFKSLVESIFNSTKLTMDTPSLEYSNFKCACTNGGEHTNRIPSSCSATWNAKTSVIVGVRVLTNHNGDGIAQILSVWYCDYWNVLNSDKYHYVVSTAYTHLSPEF